VTGSEVVTGPVAGPANSPSGGSESSGTGEDEGQNGPSGFGSSFRGLINTSSFAAEALIEEPVASGGDSSQWTDGEEGKDDEQCPPADKSCKEEPK
jgi:hypothetical protein